MVRPWRYSHSNEGGHSLCSSPRAHLPCTFAYAPRAVAEPRAPHELLARELRAATCRRRPAAARARARLALAALQPPRAPGRGRRARRRAALGRQAARVARALQRRQVPLAGVAHVAGSQRAAAAAVRTDRLPRVRGRVLLGARAAAARRRRAARARRRDGVPLAQDGRLGRRGDTRQARRAHRAQPPRRRLPAALRHARRPPGAGGSVVLDRGSRAHRGRRERRDGEQGRGPALRVDRRRSPRGDQPRAGAAQRAAAAGHRVPVRGRDAELRVSHDDRAVVGRRRRALPTRPAGQVRVDAASVGRHDDDRLVPAHAGSAGQHEAVAAVLRVPFLVIEWGTWAFFT